MPDGTLKPMNEEWSVEEREAVSVGRRQYLGEISPEDERLIAQQALRRQVERQHEEANQQEKRKRQQQTLCVSTCQEGCETTCQDTCQTSCQSSCQTTCQTSTQVESPPWVASPVLSDDSSERTAAMMTTDQIFLDHPWLAQELEILHEWKQIQVTRNRHDAIKWARSWAYGRLGIKLEKDQYGQEARKRLVPDEIKVMDSFPREKRKRRIVAEED